MISLSATWLQAKLPRVGVQPPALGCCDPPPPFHVRRMDVAAVAHDPGGAGAAAPVLDPLRTNLKPKLATELVALALQGDIAGLRQLVGQHVEFLGENEGYHRVSLGAVCQLFIDRHYQPGVVEGALFVFHARSREQAPQDLDAHGWSGSFGSRGSFVAGSSPGSSGMFKNWATFKKKDDLRGLVVLQVSVLQALCAAIALPVLLRILQWLACNKQIWRASSTSSRAHTL